MKLIKNLVFLAIQTLNNIDGIKQKIRELSELGFDGLVFHPRNYNGEPEYLSTNYMKTISEVIVFAKSLDMEFWIYDENGWPSGSAGGLVEEKLSGLVYSWLEYKDGKVEKCFAKGVNTLDENCVRTFINLTHEKYKSDLSSEAFEYITGFFSDEAGFLAGHGAGCEHGGVPWYDEIADDYQNIFGGDVFDNLDKLFAEDESGKEFKAQYWQLLTDRLHNCFYSQIQSWCNENDKKYMAHLKGEETPFFSVSYNGSCMQVMKGLNVPGIDALGRKPGNCFYPRIASSLAHQFGEGVSMCEALGGAGWGLAPENLEEIMTWLIECGINTFVFHICQAELNYKGITDWPASFPTHLPWKNSIPQIFEKLESLAEIEFKRPRKILTVIPTMAVFENYIPNSISEMNEHDGSNQPVSVASELSDKAVEICDRLHAMGRRFDITDENILENDIDFDGRGIKIGKATYSTILITPGCSFSKKGLSIIERAKTAGVRILNDIPTSDTEVIPLELIRRQTEEIVPVETCQSGWTVTYPTENLFWLKPQYNGNNIHFEFEIDKDFTPENLTLLLSDNIGNVSINNIIIEPQEFDEFGYYYNITENVLSGKNTIQIDECEADYACLIGNFAVIAKHGYLIFNLKQVQTKYDFVLKAPPIESSLNLTECGYPFCQNYVSAKKIINTDVNLLRPYIQLNCDNVSAMEVYFDNESIGFVYGTENLIKIPSLGAGEQHVVEIRAYSSAYNAYGPHFYYNGDSGLVSPSQFIGEKNFLDPPDAPENTTTSRMKLHLWALPRDVKIIQKF